MAFSDYKTIAQVQTQFAITYHEALYIDAQAIAPSPQFVAEFVFTRDYIDIPAQPQPRRLPSTATRPGRALRRGSVVGRRPTGQGWPAGGVPGGAGGHRLVVENVVVE